MTHANEAAEKLYAELLNQETPEQEKGVLAQALSLARREGAEEERKRCLENAESWHKVAAHESNKEMTGEYIARRIVGDIRGYETTGG